MILILTPVYKAYEIVEKMCQAIDQNTINPFLHILVDDDSNIREPFPVKVSENRRILFLKRDYPGIVHRNGEAQAIQLAYDWAMQTVINETANLINYQAIFLIESDVIVQPGWDEKMLEIVQTLPKDWLSLDLQSIDFEDKLTWPTLNKGNLLGLERDDLEVLHAPDFQVTLFHPKVFESGIKISSFYLPLDTTFGKTIARLFQGRHFRTKQIFAYHFLSASTKHLVKEKT